MGHPLGRLREEVAYLSFHLHWPYDTVMALDHRERRQWVAEVARLHQRAGEGR